MDFSRIDKDKQNLILSLRAKGYSYARIAQEAKVSKQTAVDLCRMYEERVATLEALELEELYETHRLTSTERIKAHASLLQRIKEEIDRRDLTDIPTDKLLDLYLKEEAALRESMIEPKFRSSQEQEESRKDRTLLDSLLRS